MAANRLLMVMNERELSGQEPPKAVAAAMKNADVVDRAYGESLTHTNARMGETEKAGSKGCHHARYHGGNVFSREQ